MGGLFGGGGGGMAQQPMPKPKVTRMPNETDPEVLAASVRTRDEALRRRGRLSTILTDQTNTAVGSSGRKLGA